MISASYVHKALGGRLLLRDVTFRIASGRIAALIGPNGSGKTTLLRILAGFDTPDRGDVTIHDQTAEPMLVGYVPQNARDALLPWLRVGRNLEIGTLPPSELLPTGELARTIDALRQLRPWQLSGGQCQLVALGRALRTRKALILDEPLSALDYRSCELAVSAIRDRTVTSNIACVLTVHDIDIALRAADELLVLDVTTRSVERCELPRYDERPEQWDLTAGYAALRRDVLRRVAAV